MTVDEWATARLTDVAVLNPPPDPIDPDTRVSLVPMAAVEAESGRLSPGEPTTFREIRRGLRPFRDGDVLFAKITPSMENGKSAVARGLHGGRGLGSTEFHIIRPGPNIDGDYLRYFLVRKDVRLEARRHMTGTAGQLRVPARYLADLRIPLPSLDRQRRIVESIEQELTRIEASERSLSSAQQRAERMRAAVLDEAWRSQAGGAFTRLADLALDSDYGTSQKATYKAAGPPILRIPNVVEGTLELRDLKFATRPDDLRNDRALLPGDFLIVRTNGSRDLIGRGAVVESEFDRPHFHASYLIRFRLRGGIHQWRWLLLMWHTPAMRRELEAMAATSAGQYNVSLRSLSGVLVPMPPENLLQDLVPLVERRLSLVGELRKEISTGLIRAARLRDAVLAHAFVGPV